jgi:hypothetical protein
MYQQMPPPPQKIYTTNVEGKFMMMIQKISATRGYSESETFLHKTMQALKLVNSLSSIYASCVSLLAM